MSASQIHMKSIANDTVWVEIMMEKNIFLLGRVYRSSNKTVENNAMLWTIHLKKLLKDTKRNY